MTFRLTINATQFALDLDYGERDDGFDHVYLRIGKWEWEPIAKP